MMTFKLDEIKYNKKPDPVIFFPNTQQSMIQSN